MIDQFGRELTYLRISVIDRCNLKCLYCMPAHGAGFEAINNLLSFDEIAELTRYFAELGIRKVRLTGGEPLVRKDISELIFKIREIPEISEMALSTNGVFLKRHARSLKKAGLDRINISLDTLNRHRFQEIAKQDRLVDVLDGIDEALETGFKQLKLNAVLLKGINQDEILDLVSFAIEKGIEIRFIELMQTNGLVQLDPLEHFMTTEEAQMKIEKIYELVPTDTYFSSPARMYEIKGTQSKIGFISPLSNQFCSRCNRLRLKASGMLKTCLHGKDDLDLKELLRLQTPKEVIKRKIQEVVWIRPEEHFLNDEKVKHNDFQMSQVGG